MTPIELVNTKEVWDGLVHAWTMDNVLNLCMILIIISQFVVSSVYCNTCIKENGSFSAISDNKQFSFILGLTFLGFLSLVAVISFPDVLLNIIYPDDRLIIKLFIHQ